MSNPWIGLLSGFPQLNTPLVDPTTGNITRLWWYFLNSLWTRTGDSQGASTVQALEDAQNAQARSIAAQASATAAQASANGAVAGVAAETARALAAEALLAPLAGANFTGAVAATQLGLGTGANWTTGAGVPTSTQPKGSIYSRTGGGIGSTLYVTQGAGVWNPIAGV